MPTVLMAEVLEDELAILLARVIAVANKCVREVGVNVAESLVTITQISDHELYWRVNYGAKDYRSEERRVGKECA